MENNDYELTLLLDQSPTEVFNAINNTRGWWSGEIVGETDKLGAEFSYRVAGVHFTRQKVTELIPGKRIVWHVTEAKIDFVPNTGEWTAPTSCSSSSEKPTRPSLASLTAASPPVTNATTTAPAPGALSLRATSAV
jgi:hypothetical protein